MLRQRIIFTLIYDQNMFVQSRNFRLQKVGNLHWLNNNYKFKQISTSLDELIILNASRNEKNSIKFASTVNSIVDSVFIPIAAGGGIKTQKGAELLFENGADKIVLNSLLYESPSTVTELIKHYGSQSVIASIDYKIVNNQPEVFIHNGTERIKYSLIEYVKYLEDLGVGEVYLNSIDMDGTGFGYDFETIGLVSHTIKIPLIIAGGAGNEKHLIDGLNYQNINAVATANLFNFIGNGLPNARQKIIEQGINVANWNLNY